MAAVVALVLACGLGLWGGRATAQVTSQANSHRFRPPPGPRLGAALPDARPLAHGLLALSVGTSYAHDVATGPDGGALGMITDLGAVEVGAAMGLYGLFELGVVVPLSVARVAPEPTAADLQAGLGDVRSQAKLAVFRSMHWVVSGAVEVSFPAAHPSGPAGDGFWTVTPSVLVRGAAGQWRWGGRLAYRKRDRANIGQLVLDDSLLGALALEWWFAQPLAVFSEVQIDLPVVQRSRAHDGLEALAGLAARLGFSTYVRAGVGLGAGLGGERGFGVPEARAMFAVTTNLGVFACESGEDLDGYRDSDGCPDLDNDGDGLLDARDMCPEDPEDADGFMDEDGCPDLDDDADGLPDAEDRCPRLTEDWDGFEDGDGCPEPDNDQDGVTDGYDVCAMEPEDHDGFEDSDGCPEPGPKSATVTVAKDRILVSERIYFEDGRDVIRAVSMPVLEQIARAVRELPADKAVRIVGHTDDSGLEEQNVDLSLRRAKSVGQALIARGVPEARLRFEGRGGREPVASSETPTGRAMNRRVELYVIPSGPTEP